MSAAPCAEPLDLQRLIAYQQGELSSHDEERVEAHYFECEHCSTRLEALTRLGDAITHNVQRGELSAPVTQRLLEQARDEGLALRQYSVRPGETVACTVLPDDDFVVIHLAGNLLGHSSVSMRIETEDLELGGRQVRDVPSVPVDQQRGEVFLLFSGPLVRSYPRSRWTMRLGPENAEPDASLGTFTLRHTPWQQLPTGAPR